MVTSRLIDINTAAIVYRRECLQALGKKLYQTCIGCIETMNSLLPEDEEELKYRIIFDDVKYNEMMDSTDKILCNKCKKESDYNDITFEEVHLPESEQIVVQEYTEMMWLCPLCKEVNRLSETQIFEDVIQTPFYYRYVPNPPTRKHDLINHLTYHDEMRKWVWVCLKNLEQAFTKFRDDNWNKGKNLDFNEMQIDTSLEEI